MKVNIKQDKSIYSINIKDGIFIWKHQLWLKSRRLLRLGKRIAIYMKNLYPVYLFALIFVILIIPVGIKLEKYTTWESGIWDMRFFLLTSLFITLFSIIYTSEVKRHEILKRQNDMYNDFLYECEVFIQSLCQSIGFYYSDQIFTTDKHSEAFTQELNKFSQLPYSYGSQNILQRLPKYMNEKTYFVLSSERFEFHIYEIYNYLGKDPIIGYKEYGDRRRFLDLIPHLNNERLIIQNIQNSQFKSEIIEFLNSELFWNIFYALASLRRPWRWDYERNQLIRRILVMKGKIISDTYDYTNHWLLKI